MFLQFTLTVINIPFQENMIHCVYTHVRVCVCVFTYYMWAWAFIVQKIRDPLDLILEMVVSYLMCEYWEQNWGALGEQYPLNFWAISLAPRNTFLNGCYPYDLKIHDLVHHGRFWLHFWGHLVHLSIHLPGIVFLAERMISMGLKERMHVRT